MNNSDENGNFLAVSLRKFWHLSTEVLHKYLIQISRQNSYKYLIQPKELSMENTSLTNSWVLLEFLQKARRSHSMLPFITPSRKICSFLTYKYKYKLKDKYKYKSHSMLPSITPSRKSCSAMSFVKILAKIRQPSPPAGPFLSCMYPKRLICNSFASHPENPLNSLLQCWGWCLCRIHNDGTEEVLLV